MTPVAGLAGASVAMRLRPGVVAGGCLALMAVPALPIVFSLALFGAVLSGIGGAGRPAGASAAAAVSPGVPLTCPVLEVARGFQPPIHAGIDLDCPPGTPVLAAAAGVVHRHEDYGGTCSIGGGIHGGGYGSYAVLDPDGSEGVREYYGHLAGYAQPDGAHIAAGAVIGYEGSTGCSTGPHLHFEIRVHGIPVNPCPYLSAGYPSPAWRAAGCPLQLR